MSAWPTTTIAILVLLWLAFVAGAGFKAAEREAEVGRSKMKGAQAEAGQGRRQLIKHEWLVFLYFTLFVTLMVIALWIA
jgi:hypothetical protein